MVSRNYLKKILCCTLSLILVLMNTTHIAFAEEAVGGQCGASQVYWSYADGVITFTGTGRAMGYNAGAQPYKDYFGSITKAVFEEGITGVASGALNGATALCEVVLPSTVTEIHGSAFYNCTSLESIEIPGRLTVIGDNAFFLSKLKTIKINPESRYTIGNYAFGYTNLTEIPYGAVSVGDHAFDNCQGIKSMTVPETVETVGEYAFRNCGSMNWIKFPANCTAIADTALYNSSNTNLETTILCPYNSYAYSYAKDKGFPYSFTDETAGSDWFFLGFEDKDISSVNAENAEISRITSDKYDGSGALSVTGAIGTAVNFKKGVTYRISAWIKTADTAGAYEFFVQNGEEKTSLPINTDLNTNEWTYVEEEYVGSGEYVGVSGGNYLIDNFAAVPLYDDVICSYNITDSGTVEFTIATATPQNGYYYEISRDGTILASGTSESATVSYTPTADDIGHTLKFTGAVVEEYERLLGFCECETQEIAKACEEAAEYTDAGLTNRIISEGFNREKEYAVFGNPTIAVSDGSAEVTVNTKYDSPKFSFSPVLGETYEISMRIKQNSGEDIPSASLFFETSGTDDGKYLYEIMENSKTPLISGEWTKLTFNYYHDGRAVLTGTGGSRFDSINMLDMSVRLGDSAGFTYLIDDVKAVPLSVNSGIRIEGENTVGESMLLNCLSASDTDGYVYTVRCEDTVIANGFTEDGRAEIPVLAEYEGKEITAEASAVFSGRISNVISKATAEIEGRKDYAFGKFYSELISGNELLGNITYENNTDTYEPTRLLAIYSGDGKRLVEVKELDDGEFDLNMEQDFDTAKLFLFDKATIKPLDNASEVKRSTGYVIYVDAVNGDDGNDASFENPLKTLGKAQERVREILPTAEADVYVMLMSGEYILDDTLAFTNSDCSENADVIYTTYGREQAVISGGKHIPSADWELHDKDKNIYRAYVGKDIRARQLYVNDVRATRARSEIKLVGLENGTYDEIGHTTTDTSYLDFKYPEDLEMVYFRAWTNPRCLVDSIYEENGVVRIKMNEIGWTNLNNKNNSNLYPNVPSYAENAYELLDEEREWYLNTHDGYLYYKPAVFEEMSTADVVIPVIEKLVTVKGDENDFAENITFKNIGFKYATWLRPSTDIGHSDSQNNKIRDGVKVVYNDDGTYEMTIEKQADYHSDAAVEVNFARNVNFIDCTFSKLGGIGLKMTDGVKEFKLKGNRVYDISGNGICIGDPSKYYEPDTEDKYVMRDIEITDNIIYDVGEEFKSSGGLSVTFAKNCLIKNNEIFRVPYSGIHIGHTPTTYTQNLRIENNYVHDCLNEELSDGGGIYHSNATAGTDENPNIISGNYVRDIMNNAWRIAFDNESSGYKVFNNVVDATRAEVMNEIAYNWAGLWEIYDLQGGYDTVIYDNNYGTHGVKEDLTITNHTVSEFGEWNEEALAIIANAGLSTEYEDKFSDIVRKIETDEGYELESGETADIGMLIYGYKDSMYNGSCDIYFTDVDENIVRVTADGVIEAVGEGETELTLYFVNNDTLITKNITVNVI
ncbi:MAG: leucine-rich repeat protein [Clostridia bacterium]|nr:leucine-rich repeat protein [Clostridia bacterium]